MRIRKERIGELLYPATSSKDRAFLTRVSQDEREFAWFKVTYKSGHKVDAHLDGGVCRNGYMEVFIQGGGNYVIQPDEVLHVSFQGFGFDQRLEDRKNSASEQRKFDKSVDEYYRQLDAGTLPELNPP